MKATAPRERKAGRKREEGKEEVRQRDTRDVMSNTSVRPLWPFYTVRMAIDVDLRSRVNSFHNNRLQKYPSRIS